MLNNFDEIYKPDIITKLFMKAFENKEKLEKESIKKLLKKLSMADFAILAKAIVEVINENFK